MRILITGATGFIGRAVAKAAVSRGHQVACLIRSDKSPGRLQDFNLRGTMANPPWREIEVFNPDACIHAAWVSSAGPYLNAFENRDHLEWSLAFGRELARRGVRHLTVLGTCLEYQAGDELFEEERTPIAPASLYAESKVALHHGLRGIGEDANMTLTWGRVFYPYGPGEAPTKLCSSLLERFAAGQSVELKTPGAVKDYIYISDLAEALLLVTEKRYDGPINLGTGAGISVHGVAQLIRALLGSRSSLVFSDGRGADPSGNIVADSRRLRSLGWRQRNEMSENLWTMARTLGAPVGDPADHETERR